MICFMFPGQPFSASAALPNDDDWAEIAELVRQQAHFDLEIFAWIGAEGTEQVGFQLMGVARSLHRMRRLRSQGVRPDVVAQHSMGIYPALVACNSLPEAQAVELTWRIGSCLAQLGKSRQYSLGSVVGLALGPLRRIARKNRVHLANHNTSRHFLLSGGRGEMEQAVAEALAAGAYSARSLDCDAPIHTRLVAPLAGELEGIISDYRYAEPEIPLMNHLNQDYLRAGDIPRFLLQELQLPVYWEWTYQALCQAGVCQFLEVGEGETLRKFNRWIDAGTDKPVLR
jgi:[acyl-carrier-protein] S-malonyltransferase